jgi:hypothetical protein
MTVLVIIVCIDSIQAYMMMISVVWPIFFVLHGFQVIGFESNENLWGKFWTWYPCCGVLDFKTNFWSLF